MRLRLATKGFGISAFCFVFSVFLVFEDTLAGDGVFGFAGGGVGEGAGKVLAGEELALGLDFTLGEVELGAVGATGDRERRERDGAHAVELKEDFLADLLWAGHEGKGE